MTGQSPKSSTECTAQPYDADNDDIVEAFKCHYSATFAAHGATSQGVNWGVGEKVSVRYAKMLEVIEAPTRGDEAVSLLDVGCGYGGLLAYAKEKGIPLDYAGIDVVPEMIAYARNAHPEARFHVGDVLETDFGRQFDYAACNGILTLKLHASLRQADAFAHRLLRKMFSLARCGIVFNTMSTYVDFFGSNGYHKSPAEMLAFCASELSPRLRLDHAYAPYEYSVFVYRAD